MTLIRQSSTPSRRLKPKSLQQNKKSWPLRKHCNWRKN